jgi:hypothetical protein
MLLLAGLLRLHVSRVGAGILAVLSGAEDLSL